MRTSASLAFGLVFVCLTACGDDEGSGGAGGNGTTTSTTATSTGATSSSVSSSSSSASSGSTTSSSASTTAMSSSSTGMQMTGCEERSNECVTNQQECSCNGTCTICGKQDCTDFQLEVSCIDGFAGVTCTCIVNGQDAGSCSDNSLTCDLEGGCCYQFLPMPL